MSDVDDLEDWKYEDLHPEDGEPECWDCWNSESGSCWTCQLPPARVRRKHARHWQQQRRGWRKLARHHNDRFWQARNRPAFDEEAPF